MLSGQHRSRCTADRCRKHSHRLHERNLGIDQDGKHSPLNRGTIFGRYAFVFYWIFVRSDCSKPQSKDRIIRTTRTTTTTTTLTNMAATVPVAVVLTVSTLLLPPAVDPYAEVQWLVVRRDDSQVAHHHLEEHPWSGKWIG